MNTKAAQPMWIYLLGVITLPTLALALWLTVHGLGALSATLDNKFGIKVEVRTLRDEPASDFMLRRDIWWEKTHAKVFITGGWYREGQPGRMEHRLFNQWVGVGNPNGYRLLVFRKYDLGLIVDTSTTVAA